MGFHSGKQKDPHHLKRQGGPVQINTDFLQSPRLNGLPGCLAHLTAFGKLVNFGFPSQVGIADVQHSEAFVGKIPDAACE
jgi:hypothetical protein